jgi:DNA-binding transcriptional ArsR family regulator
LGVASGTDQELSSMERDELVEAFKALSNPLRLQILEWLREPQAHFPIDQAIADPHEVGICVSHIRAKSGLAQSTVSAYLSEMQRAGLLRATRIAQWTHYKRDEERIAHLAAIIGHRL